MTVTMWECPRCGRIWIGRMLGPWQFDMTEWWGPAIAMLRGDNPHYSIGGKGRLEEPMLLALAIFESCTGIPETVAIPDHVMAAYLIGGQNAAQDLINDRRQTADPGGVVRPGRPPP